MASGSLGNRVGRYISLETAINSTAPKDILASSSTRLDFLLGSADKGAQLSPASTEYKRFYSYAEDTVEKFKPLYRNKKITQSWNPLYMMNQGASKSLNASQGKMEVDFIELQELTYSTQSAEKKESILNDSG